MGVIPAGLLNELLTVLAPTRVTNNAGGWTDTWNAAGTVRGSVSARRRSTMEVVAGSQPSDVALADIYCDTSVVPVTGKDRIQQADGTVWELVAATHQGTLLFAMGRAV